MARTAGEPLLIVGASARAAAESARRGGFRPYTIDLFGDADLAEVAEVRQCRNFPYDIVDLARTVPACDWLYVGGLENYPDIVDELAAERRLLGNSGNVLRRARDPRELRDTLCRHGVSFPESIFDPSELDRLTEDEPQPPTGWSGAEPTLPDTPWLVKSRSSSGGLGVAPLRIDRQLRSSADPFVGGRYYQRRIAGLPFGAVYLAAPHGTCLLGISLQLMSRSDDGMRPFRYAGSVGPERLANLAATGLDEKLDKIGGLATSGFRLSGIFSLDFILDEMRTPWLLEINPRYTASVELIERAMGDTEGETSLIARHVAACRSNPSKAKLGSPLALYPEAGSVYGKRIVYAKRDIERVPESLTKQLLTLRADVTRDGSWPTVADIPSVGSAIRRDEPLATVFASGATENAVLEALERREEEFHALLDRLTSVP